jgi:apolipoprotein N-acyltransferase
MDMAKIKEVCLYRFAGAISGFLLMIPNLYPALAPLHIFALLPVLYLGARRNNRLSNMLTAGIYMGLFYTLPQMIMLRLPVPITVILLVHLVVIITVLTFVSAWLIRREPFWGAFAVGAFLVVLDWINFTAIPLWGTAQSIVRSWSQYPSLIQFSSLTGITGIVFVLGTLQALIVSSIVNPKMRQRLLSMTASLVLVFAITDVIIRYQRPAGKLKVAAIGWATEGFADVEYAQTPEGFEELFAKPAAKAARQGAKLIVSPEMGFYINKYDRSEWLKKFQTISSKYNVFLAVGYFDASEKQNRLIYITPDGKSLPEYNKTYLIPFFEDYQKGNGQLRIADINGISAGGMICQDDNFTRFSREYGRKKVSVVAVPTLDWSAVKSAHLQNSIHRAIESRYAIIRAAMNGISAIIAPGGQVLASCDHFTDGPAVIVAEVPIYKCRTFFSFAGHWPVAVSLIFLIAYISRTSTKKRSKNTTDQK